ncbi:MULTISPECIES: DUF433 domain-containing protein [unclassified Aureimonas]|uniref:DUF433 domain-containing protein n=1 Tax=unclassified Aureimonas TaxID=2615206 RepID=UPI0009E755F7|nr:MULTISPECIES: DUF433 domain-containing protein [unclassified Aureimonas]
MRSDARPVVVRQEGVLGGRPTFRGTRVQAEILFENLAGGYSLDEIADDFPTLDRDDLRAAIIEAGRLIIESAPCVPHAASTDADPPEVPRARLSR